MIYRVPVSKAFHSARRIVTRSSIIVRVALVVTRCFIRSTMIRTRNLPVIDHPFVMSHCSPPASFLLHAFYHVVLSYVLSFPRSFRIEWATFASARNVTSLLLLGDDSWKFLITVLFSIRMIEIRI